MPLLFGNRRFSLLFIFVPLLQTYPLSFCCSSPYFGLDLELPRCTFSFFDWFLYLLERYLILLLYFLIHFLIDLLIKEQFFYL